MRSVLTPILLLLVLVQGATRSLCVDAEHVILCLGGGHHTEAAHEHEDSGVECTDHCGHQSDWPSPVLVHDNDKHCCCTDIKFTPVELLTIPSDDGDELPEAEWIDVPACRGPPAWSRDDPGGAQRLVMVRATRLIL
jgi:hypothetical protein